MRKKIDAKWVWIKLFPGIIFIGGFTTLFVHGQRNQYLLRTYPRYTIGTTIKTYWTFASGHQLEYEHEVKNKYYKNSDRFNENSIVPGGRYYVKFYSNDPDICEILQDIPVPDSIKTAPINGWEKIPE